jgi:hypothetical protein
MPQSTWEPLDDHVGAALIALAGGKVPRRIATQIGEDVSTARRDAARRFIASHLLAFDANHYRVLGAPRSMPAELLRKNYQRMMTLVHPDSFPIGFPLGAAARVNEAYATLSDAARRDDYDATLANAMQTSPTVAYTDHAPITAFRRAHESRWARLTRLLPGLGFRKGLIAIGVCLLMFCVYGLYQLLSPETHVTLVEARPRLSQSVELSASTPNGATTNFAPQETPPDTNQSSTSTLKAIAPTGFVSPLRLTTELRQTVADKAASRPNQTASTETSPGTAVEPPMRASLSNRPQSATATAFTDSSTAPSSRSQDTASTTETRSSENVSPKSDAATQPPSPLRDERAAADIDSLLAQFASAFEAGSLSSMKQSFSTNMSGRNAVLADYERVFQSTKQRNIHFSRMRHSPLSSERILTSGIATVATVDMENRSVRQRVFLEIEISREPAGARISRIANYEQP